MSIKHEGKSWCFVDEEHFLNDSFSNVLNDSSFERYVCNPNMFDISQQYLYDSQYMQHIQSVTPNTIGKKRKRRHNEHSEIEILIQSHLKELTDLNLNVCSKQEFSDAERKDNNINARSLQSIVDTQLTFSLDEDICEQDAINDIKNAEALDLNRVTSCLVSNPHDTPLLKEISSQKFLIPSKSTFVMSDMASMDSLLEADELFDCIVMDPPWQNKSVKRKRVYNSMPMFDLKMLPITNLCNKGCLVVVWVTNKTKLQDYIKNELFPYWKVTFESEWYWVKVTKHFVPVLPLNSHHKKPYEKLIVGRYRGSNCNPKIPKDMTIISIPSSIHSHKPPLTNVLKKYLPEDAKCLELFARNLLPGWYSWGNQVLLLQNEKLFNSASS